METAPRPERRWAEGIGLVLLGLGVSAVANSLALHGDPGPLLRTLGVAGYLAGLVVSGAGIHRLLWVGPSARRRGARLLITALVTVPTFVATALLLSLLFTIVQMRFMF